jgi:SAM-dependent methyltransferase
MKARNASIKVEAMIDAQEEQRQCRGCGNPLPSPFFDLGKMPLANSYLASDKDCACERQLPLAVVYCESCHLVQLAETVNPDDMFLEYAYFSSYSRSFLEHARLMAESLVESFALGPDSRVLEIASNDGYLLGYFKQRGPKVLGIDPARNIVAEAIRQGIPTLCRFFNKDLVAEIVANFGKADLILGNNVLAHVPEINDFLGAVAACLKPDGAAVFEFPYVGELLDKGEFDTIYHEHVFYFSLNALRILVERARLELFDVSRQSVHGGSLRLSLQLPGVRPIGEAVIAMLNEEDRIGLTRRSRYSALAQRARNLKDQLRSMLSEIKAAGNRIAAYGAPAKGNTLLNYCGIGRDLLDFTVDRSPHKQGKRLPGSHLEIMAPEELLVRRPEYTVILPWNIADEIIGQQEAYLRAGGKFIVPVPSPRVVEASSESRRA